MVIDLEVEIINQEGENMIRTEIRFKNAAFVNSLKKNGYKSVVEFSEKSGISYGNLINYANLKNLIKDSHHRKTMCDLLKTDEWTLFLQYEEVVEKHGKGHKKIVKDIPISKILSLGSKELLKIEADKLVENNSSLKQFFLKNQIRVALKTLTYKERDVIEMHFGLNDYKREYTFKEISKKYNISKERIRQIQCKAIRRLRHWSRSDNLKEFVY